MINICLKENKMYPWTPEPNKVSDFDNFNPLKEKLVNLL